MADVLLVNRPHGVGLITLNRPESLNAMGGRLIPMLGEYLEQCAEDREIRCVAVTGAGRGFCAGGDVKGMQTRNTRTTAVTSDGKPNIAATIEDVTDELRGWHNSTSLLLHTMPKPTVALVNGVAVGAGLSVALACDIRIASDTARFGTAFKNIALSGDFGGAYFLPRLVGAAKARELYFSAEIMGAQAALELGIVNRVVPQAEFMEEGMAYCAKLAAGPTATYARMKRNLNLGETGTLQEVLDQEAFYQRLGGYSRDSREAVAAFIEKRDPVFVGE
jgi:2-(1,2-epoxy-1,2-dihydrophenyl)acetyl-CoA isomerase